jgi:hypothetical protein
VEAAPFPAFLGACMMAVVLVSLLLVTHKGCPAFTTAHITAKPVLPQPLLVVSSIVRSPLAHTLGQLRGNDLRYPRDRDFEIHNVDLGRVEPGKVRPRQLGISDNPHGSVDTTESILLVKLTQVLAFCVARQQSPHAVPRFRQVPLAGLLVVLAPERSGTNPWPAFLCTCYTATDRPFHYGEPFMFRNTGKHVVAKSVACLAGVEPLLGVNQEDSERALEEASPIDDVSTAAGKARDVIHHHSIKGLVRRVPHHLLELVPALHLAAGFGLIDIYMDERPAVCPAIVLNRLTLPRNARIVALAFAACAAIPCDA